MGGTGGGGRGCPRWAGAIWGGWGGWGGWVGGWGGGGWGGRGGGGRGGGGWGKTTVARLVRSDRRVLRRFGGRVYWVTLGRDARRGVLVEKVNDLVRRVDPARAQPFIDVRQAAEHLAAVLADGPRRLLIL